MVWHERWNVAIDYPFIQGAINFLIG